MTRTVRSGYDSDEKAIQRMVTRANDGGYFPDPAALDKTVAFLNNGWFREEELNASTREELRALAKAWLAVSADYTKFIERMLRAKKGFSYKGTFHLVAAMTGKPVPVLSPAWGATHAEGIFLQFILHPDHRQLSGPCKRVRCDRYFLRKTSHPKFYCSQRCASLTTAQPAMKRKREELHRQELAEAQHAVSKWELSRRQGEWMTWVQTQTGFSARRLDRWVACGDLKEPAGRGRRNAKG